MSLATRTLLGTSLLLCLVLVLTHKKPPKLRPKITLSNETTRANGPVNKDGYVDYMTVINQRLSAGVTAESNSNVLLWKAMGPHPLEIDLGPEFFRLMKMEPPPETGDYFSSLPEFLSQQLKLKRSDTRWNKIQKNQSAATSQPWTATDYPEIAAWLKQNEEPLLLISKATRRPDYFSPLVINAEETDLTANGQDPELAGSLIYVLLPGTQQARPMARALTTRAMLHLDAGRPEAAWEDLIACHRLGRLVAKGATVIDALVGVAICSVASDATLEYIDHVKPNARDAALLAHQLDQLPPLPQMADGIDLHERLTFLDVTQRIAAAKGTNFSALVEMHGETPSAANKALTNFAFRLTDWDLVLKKGNAVYDRLVKTMRIKDRVARKKAIRAFEQDLKERAVQLGNPLKLIGKIGGAANAPEGLGDVFGDILISMMLPSLSETKSAELSAFQVHDHLQLALALAAYHVDQGNYPDKLLALKPKYLQQIPLDRFSGKAIIYRPSEQGYLFYSIGRNEKDDQGQSHDDEPGADDLRVRMPRKAFTIKD